MNTEPNESEPKVREPSARQPQVGEPTVLDYVKSLLTPWRGKPLQLPPADRERGAIVPEEGEWPPEAAVLTPSDEPTAVAPALKELERSARQPISLPWRPLLTLGLALLAQLALEPRPIRGWELGVFFYILAAAWLVWITWRGEWSAAALPPDEVRPANYQIRATPFLLGLLLAVVAYMMLGGNQFTTLNVTVWVLALLSIGWALWEGTPSFKQWWVWLRERLRPPWKTSLPAWTLVILVAAGLVVFFRVYRLGEVPPEMVSDQAEKLLDVWDVLHGQTSIFFPRNTGREALQMYLTAAIVRLFGTGISYMSLKIGTALAGLCTLPYIYLLGKETGNRRVGLFAMVLAGIAYWPNVISRVGLRFPFYPLFVAPTLYYLMRGLRTSKRNDFILAGLALGIGLHGYTPIRILPFIVLVAVGLYLLHRQARGLRGQTVWKLIALVLISLIIFLPLLRFSLEHPDLFGLRTFSRLGTTERPLPGPAWQIFLKNLWNASIMFFWSDGRIWVHSVTHRPALDVVSAALFFLGVVLLLVRYLRQRKWQDLFLLLSVPLLMMPSILSLAFPDENPALNRAAGAMVPVFLIAAIALDGLWASLKSRLGARFGAQLAWGLVVLLVALSARQNFDLVFNQYQRAYELSAWNTSEMGEVMRNFGELFGSTETVWVVAYPHWVDTRLVSQNAGVPFRDAAIQPAQLADTVDDPRPKLFMIKPEDQAAIDALRQLYPGGALHLYDSPLENKDFWLFLVLPASVEPQSGELQPPPDDTAP